MARESVGAAEYERLVARIGNEKFLARPYTGRREDMPVSECVRKAALCDRAIPMASGTLTGLTPVIARLAVYRAENVLAARGRETTAFTLLLSVPATMPEAEVRPFLREAYSAASFAAAEIIRQDTDTVTAHVTAYGEPYGAAEAAGAEAEAEADGPFSVILCGETGAEETLLLYEENRERLQAKYPSHFLAELPKTADSLRKMALCKTAWEHGALYQYACGDGGVYAGLYAMSERLRTGFTVELPEIPISQKTIEICEELDIDPYQIGAGGCVLMITKDTDRLLQALFEAGAEAAVIGTLRNDRLKELRNKEESRCLEPFRGRKHKA